MAFTLRPDKRQTQMLDHLKHLTAEATYAKAIFKALAEYNTLKATLQATLHHNEQVRRDLSALARAVLQRSQADADAARIAGHAVARLDRAGDNISPKRMDELYGDAWRQVDHG